MTVKCGGTDWNSGIVVLKCGGTDWNSGIVVLKCGGTVDGTLIM